jgi:sugar phosphate isomerase/epimerase
MKYRIGICSSLDRAPLLARIGADHIEPAFGVIAGMEEAAYQTGVAALRDSGLRADSMNSMLPGTTVLYGDGAPTEQLLDFVRRGMSRAAELGCSTVVFGSGTARRIPEGMSKAGAQQHLAILLDRFCSIARPYDIRIAIEPLRASETNFIHTSTDAAEIAALLPHCDNLGINPDIYHMLESSEPFDTLSAFRDKLYHVHMCAPDRHFPRADRPAADIEIYTAFFRALNAAGYSGTISIEGITQNLAAEGEDALRIIRAARDASEQ